MNRSWSIALVVSVGAHLVFYVGPWSVSRTVAEAKPPVMVTIELPPPEPPPPEEPPPPPPEEPPPEPPAEEPPPEPPPPKPRAEPPPEPPPEPAPASEPVAAIPEPSPVPIPTSPNAKPTPEPPPIVPTPVSPPSPKPAPKPGLSKADFVAYAKGMRGRLLAHRRYPPAALRNGLQGVVKVKISVDRRGRIVGSPTVAKSCGHPVLDKEALRIAKVASPYAPLPDNASKDVMVFVIPIDFKIER